MNEYLAACLALPQPYLSIRGGFPHSSWDTVDYWRRRDAVPRVDYRFPMVQQYAWAIPNDEAIAALTALSPLVEIGAGRGYWAHLLRESGADLLAFDTYPTKTMYWSPRGYRGPEDVEVPAGEAAWSEVLHGGPERTARYPDRTLLLVWPPMSGMAARALRAYRGQTVAYVGEGRGGCTANDAFHAALERNWRIEREIVLPQWDGIHDDLTIYRRQP